MTIVKENPNNAAELRTVAEAKVAAQVVATESLNGKDVRRLYHELQIHQVELEMQNEELTSTKLDLEATRNSYFNLYDLAPVGYLTLSKDGLIERSNLTAASMLSLEKTVLINKPIQKLIFRDDIDSFYLQSRSAIERSENFKLELRFVQSDGSPFWVNLQASLQNDDELWIAFSDIGDRKQLEQALRQANDTLEERVATRTEELATAVASLQQEAAERIQAEEAQKESETKYRELVQNANSVIIRWRCDGTIVFFNEYAQSLFGYGADEIIGRDVRILVPETESTGGDLTELIRNIVAHPANYMKNINENVCRDGHRIWLAWTNKPIFDERGGVAEILAVGVDITELKKAEEALQASEEQLRSLADSIPNLAWWANGDGYITWYNRRWYEYTGTAPEQMEGWGWQSVHDPVELPKVMERWQGSIATGKPFDMTLPLRGADGVFRLFLTRALPLKDSAGQVVRWFGTNTDVSELKRVEQAALHLSEQEFHSLAESMPQIVWATLPDGWTIYFNQQWVDYTGLTMEESYGHGWNTPFHPDDRQRAWDAWQLATQHNELYSLECRLRRADGVYRWWLIRGVPMLGVNGEILKWFGTCTDIEEIKLAEAELQMGNALLEQRVTERTLELLDSEQQFRVLIQNLQTAVALINEIGEFVIVNKSFLRVFELDDYSSIKNVNDRDWSQWQVFDEDGSLLDVDEHPVRKAALTGTPVRDKLVAVKAPENPKLKWLLLSAEPLMDAQGHIHLLICTYHDFTERKQAEEALRISDERLRLAQDVAGIGVWEWNPQTNQTIWSPEIERMYEVAPGTLTDYETWRKLVYPEDLARVEAETAEALVNRSRFNIDFRIVRPSGQLRWITTLGGAVNDDSGQVVRAFGVNLDITERKKAEELLATANRQIQSIVDNTTSIVYAFDLEERFVLANAVVAKLFNSTPDQMIGKRRHDFMPQTDADWHEANDRKVIEEGQALDFEEQSEFPGRSITWLTTKFPLRDATGKIYAVGGISTDITERIHSEKARAALAAIVESSEDAVIGENLDGTITSWNSGAEHLFGYQADEMIGQSIFLIIPPELQVEETDILHRVNKGQPISHYETERLAKDGRRISVSLTVSPIRDASGVIIGASKIARDITERKQAETYRNMGQDILLVLSENEHLKEAIKRVFAIIKSATGVDAVGIRLQDNDDFPYFYQEGFPEDFLLKENSLLARTKDGGICRDECGDICLECTCGLVVTSKTDPSIRFFTKGGSAWTNDSIPFPHEPVDDDIRTNPRDECIHQGFASVALIPIRAKGRVVGLLQLNDRRKGCFTLEGIETLEKIAENIGESMLRKQAEEALRKLHAELENRVKERTVELATSIESLQKEIAERAKAEQSLFRLNQLYAVLSETNQSIVKVTDRNILFREFCRIAVEHGGFLLSWVGLVDEASGEVRLTAACGKTAYLDDIVITATEEPEGEGPTGITIRNGTYFICNDFQNDPCTRPWHERGKAYGINASAAVALKDGNRVVGVLTLYSGEKNYFDQQQVELLQQMGMDISYAIDNFNREEARKDAEQALYLEATERLKTVEALREKEQMLIQQSRQAAMGEMIGNIAHQWRQPLNTLGLHAQMLGVFYGSPSFNKEFLDNSTAKTMEIIKHMSETIDDFRDYFKPEKEKADFSVIEAIKNTMSLLEGNFHNPKITIDIVDHGNPIINGYQNEFAQVILNILNNARDAIIEREITDARVTIMICSENNCAVVTVADNAGGIPDEVIKKVFDPYFTTKGPQVGTGIGLFMSKTIIEKNMGGRLTVRNTDIGAEFRIEVDHETQN